MSTTVPMYIRQVQVTILAHNTAEPAVLTPGEARRVLERVWNPSELGAVEPGSFDGDWLVDFREDRAAEILISGFSGDAVAGGARYGIEIEPTAR